MSGILGGIIRQLFLLFESIISILIYLLVSKVKDLSYKFRPGKRQQHALFHKMDKCTEYNDWEKLAKELDSLSGRDFWKYDPASPLYKSDNLTRRLQLLRQARLRNDWEECMLLLRENLVRSIGGLGNPLLYTSCHVGTKKLIEEYIDEVVLQLNYIADNDIPGISLNDKERFFANSRQGYGRTALLLSGGMLHFGVVKCLIENNLLPPVICGASIGAMVAALLAIHTDDELPALLSSPNFVNFSAFEGLTAGSARRKISRLLKYGVLMDVTVLERFCKDNVPDVTFAEAYKKTRRLISIVVTHPAPGVPTVLNHITTPDVLLWSAACVSSYQPGLYARVELMAKNFDGKVVPFIKSDNASGVENTYNHDLPMTRMSQLFNVDHFIVSQVNPHIVAFARASKSYSRSGILHRIAMGVGHEVRHLLRQAKYLNLTPGFLADFAESQQGHITIVPNLSLKTITQSLSNPSAQSMVTSMVEGAKGTFRQMSIIQTRCRVERALHLCTLRMRDQQRRLARSRNVSVRVMEAAIPEFMAGLAEQRLSEDDFARSFSHDEQEGEEEMSRDSSTGLLIPSRSK